MNVRNYSLLEAFILEEILGTSTTYEMSHKLGFKFDKFKRWVKGEKILKWDEFAQLCATLDLDLASAYASLNYVENEEVNFFSHLKQFNNFTTNSEMATYLKCHRSVIQRQINDFTTPDVQSVIKLIGKRRSLIGNFILKLFKNKINNSSLKQWVQEDIQSNLISDKDLESLVGIVSKISIHNLQTPTDEWLAQSLNVDVKDINKFTKKSTEKNTPLNEISFTPTRMKMILASPENISKMCKIIDNAHMEIMKLTEDNSDSSDELEAMLLQTFNFAITSDGPKAGESR